MFLLKKILPLFFCPVPLCLELLLGGLALLWLTRRQRAEKILVSAGAGLLLILGYSFVPDLVLRPLERQYPPVADLAAGRAGPNEAQSIKYIVVLGGSHTSDPNLPVTSQIGAESLYRVLEGVRLYRAGLGRKLILSGGGGESQILSRIALIMGVNPPDIIQEYISPDTEEQARLIKPMLGREKFFLVTSAFSLTPGHGHVPETGTATDGRTRGPFGAAGAGMVSQRFFSQQRRLAAV